MNLPLAVTMGEPAGVGGEIALQAFAARREQALPPFFLIDDPARLEALAQTLGLGIAVRAIARPAEATAQFATALPVLALALAAPVVPGRPDAANAKAVLAAIEQGVAFCRAGEAAGLVTNPIHKETLYTAGFHHPGHTEFLAALDGASRAVMLLTCPTLDPGLRVVPVTVHCSLKEAIARLTPTEIVETALVVERALRRDFGIAEPRLAVAGLNPHAGEGGHLGREEIEILAPALRELVARGIHFRGPLPPDTMFHGRARARYDAALCMYHDQALIPLKTLGFESGVNVTLGLSFVRTSPDHGTALDIAGQGKADPQSLIAALKLAGEMAKTRAAGGR